MTSTQRFRLRLSAIPSAREMLLAAAIWPVLFATACWNTPQLAEYLHGLGLQISLWTIFLQGLSLYVFLLGHHKRLGCWHYNRHAPEIDRHRQLTLTLQHLVTAGLTNTCEFRGVVSERDHLEMRLGHYLESPLVDRELEHLRRLLKAIGRFLGSY